MGVRLGQGEALGNILASSKQVPVSSVSPSSFHAAQELSLRLCGQLRLAISDSRPHIPKAYLGNKLQACAGIQPDKYA